MLPRCVGRPPIIFALSSPSGGVFCRAQILKDFKVELIDVIVLIYLVDLIDLIGLVDLIDLLI